MFIQKRKPTKNSGIESAAKEAGGIMVSGEHEKYYEEVRIPRAKILKKTKMHELILESDVFINIPVLKHHKSASVTIAMKNLMGIVWDRWNYHHSGLHQCIADTSLYRKPDLNIVDAYRVTLRNGPQRAQLEDVSLKKQLLVSSDIVAIDSAATKIFAADPQNINYIKFGHQQNVGNMNLKELKIKKIVA
ncbi:DUF362 domain-containing protein [Candidatus Auribacterota bacterium]